MSKNTIKITSNDSTFLEKISNDLEEDRVFVELEKVPVKHAMGFDVVLEISLTDIMLILGYIKFCIIDGGCKVFLKDLMGKKKPVDAEVLKDKEKIIELIKEEGSNLYIEHQKEKV
jgi:hypothetical protein